MSRRHSVATSGGRKHRQEEPKEGSRMRALWDMFTANPGAPITLVDGIGIKNNTLEYLKDQYGLDIRTFPQPSNNQFSGPRKWCVLVGEDRADGSYADHLARTWGTKVIDWKQKLAEKGLK